MRLWKREDKLPMPPSDPSQNGAESEEGRRLKAEAEARLKVIQARIANLERRLADRSR